MVEQHRPAVIDCLQYCNYSQDIFLDLRAGGVDAIHTTISYHEGFREMVDNIVRWNRWFDAYPDLIFPGRTADDVRKAQTEGRTAVFFGLQSCSPIEGDIGLVEVLHALGVRFMQLSYNNQSLLATGCYEENDPGITRMGREVIAEMNRVGMVVDMSHSATRSTLEAIELSRRPIAVTHANAHDWHAVPRNKPVEVLKALAKTGGMLGFSLYPHHLRNGSACSLDDFCTMVARTAKIMGAGNIGIGSDLCQGQPDAVVQWMRRGKWTKEPQAERAAFPAQPTWFQSNRDFGQIADGLARVGFSQREVDAIMGENWVRFYAASFDPAATGAASPVAALKTALMVRTGENSSKRDTPLRTPGVVMRLARLGSFHQTRLSFMRVLLRQLAKENWTFARTVWNIDAKGVGHAVYEARGNGRVYSLVAFANDLDPSKRTDRVIAQEWDSTFALHEGVPTHADIERLSRNVPKQEAGRCGVGEIVLARANKSVRLFEQVADKLAVGAQPDAAELDAVGYLMRTTAVYGSGKFGMADYEAIRDRPEFSTPYAAELLAVWLIRAYTIDLVEHMARARAPQTAVLLDPALRRRLGVGNSTGLGMAPFMVTHAALIDRWITARETALARVRSVPVARQEEIAVFRDRLARGRRQIEAWKVDDADQMARIEELGRDLASFAAHVDAVDLGGRHAWDGLYRFAEGQLGLEAQEFVVTLLIEPYGELVDDLARTMACDEAETFLIDGSMTLARLARTIDTAYDFALDIDFDAPAANARFWYVSQEKLEPRLGERFSEDGADLEQPLAIARDVKALRKALSAQPPDSLLADFLLDHPQFRHVVRRVQLAAQRPYAEIRDNLIDAAIRPIDLLRCKLSFFGADGFDPRSDRWVRIALFRHAPLPGELDASNADDWAFPPMTPDPPMAARRPSGASPTPSLPLRVPGGDGLSLNELDVLVRKAARGAGLSWGLAEETGKAARTLATNQPAMFEALTQVLEAQHAGRLSTAVVIEAAAWTVGTERPINPLALGAAICDHAFLASSRGLHVSGAIFHPELLLPSLVAACNLSGRSMLIRTERGATTCRRQGWDADASRLLENVRRIDIEQAQEGSAAAACVAAAGPVPDALIRRLEALAYLTYVPSSEQSRATGAGAGLNDND